MKKAAKKTGKKINRKSVLKLRIKSAAAAKKPELAKKMADIAGRAAIIVLAAVVLGFAANGLKKSIFPEKKVVEIATPVPVVEPTVAPANTPVVIKKPVIAAKYAHLLNRVKTKEEMQKIHVDEAKALYESGRALFVDARGEGEYNESHIKGAVSVPAGAPPGRIQGLSEVLKNKVLITYCHGVGCHLADKTAYVLFDEGYRKIVIFFGGWPEWTQANLPVESYEPPLEYRALLEEAANEKEIAEVSVEQVKFMYDKSLVNIFDVDDTGKFNEAHIVRAVSGPLQSMDRMMQSYDNWLKQKTVVIYSRDDMQKAKNAAAKLYKAGYKKLLIFVYDTSDWEKAGYPLYRAPQQVR